MRERIDFTGVNYGNKANNSIIKVIGVGGGGGNAVRHMYSEGIIGIDFLICNTDRQVLEANQVPSKLILGDSGLGAGAKPEVARDFALNSKEKIIEFIGESTKMLFITAGMGKGTGTGAAPVIAQIAHEMGILTIGVVTYPFKFEGKVRMQYADAGIEEMKKYVDSLIVVKNQNIIKYYKDETMDAAFGYADDVLKNAVKCIAELITVNADQNIDFKDIETVMKNSGPAMLGLATAKGEDRVETVVKEALKCPLLDENLITNAQNFLFFISYGKENPLKISELETLTERFEEYKSSSSDVIWGRAVDDSLGDAIKLSVIITNYNTVESPVEIPLIPEEEMMVDAEQPQINSEKIIENPFDEKDDVEETFKKMIEEAQQTQTQTQPTAEIEVKLEKSVPIFSDFESERIEAVLSTFNDKKYEDDDFFASLVDKPAYLREEGARKRNANESDYELANFNALMDMNSDVAALTQTLPD